MLTLQRRKYAFIKQVVAEEQSWWLALIYTTPNTFDLNHVIFRFWKVLQHFPLNINSLVALSIFLCFLEQRGCWTHCFYSCLARATCNINNNLRKTENVPVQLGQKKTPRAGKLQAAVFVTRQYKSSSTHKFKINQWFLQTLPHANIVRSKKRVP